MTTGASTTNIGLNLPINSGIAIYMWTNVSDATAGTTQEEYQVSSLG